MNWRRAFFENYKAKVALFLMAAFMWFFVVSSREYVQTMKVPVRTVNMPAGRVLLQDLPHYAQVRFRGKGTSLLLFGLFGRPHLNVDLSASSNSYQLNPGPDQVEWSPAIEVQALDVVTPDTIAVLMDNLAQKRLKVKPRLTFKLKEGFAQVAPVKVRPDSVLAVGARSILQHLDYALTQAKTVEDVTDGLDISLLLIAPGDGKVTFDPSTVNVHVNVEKVVEKQFSALPIEITEAPGKMQITVEPDQVSVRLRGAISRMDSLSREDISIKVSAAAGPVEGRGYPLSVTLPDCVSLVEINPVYVELIIGK